MRVATYTRISTDEAHQPYSLEAQAQRLGAYVASQGDWQLLRRFSDQVSGATLERPGLRRALTEAGAGRFDLLLVYRVDRLARSVRGLAQILEELDYAGVAFRSATEPFDTTTAAGRMMVQMLGVFAEFERATIIDRVIAGMERKAAKGGWCGGALPFGYDLDRAAGHLRVNPLEAPLVATIFELYGHGRLGARAIANQLNTQGRRTKTGRPWSHTAVLTVLANRVYLGEVYFRGTYHPAPHPPLVDADLFGLVQDVLADRNEHVSKRAANGSDYLLAGLVVCSKCGKRFVGNAAHGRSYRYRYYTCFSRQRYGTATCDAERLSADELDDAVQHALLDLYEQTDLFDQAAAHVADRTRDLRRRSEAELVAVHGELGGAEDAVERYLLAFEAGTLPVTHCGERLRTLGARIDQLRHRHAELTETLKHATAEPPTDEDLDRIRSLVRDTIQTGANRDRKTLLQALIHEVRVDGRDRIRPTFRVPADGSGPKVRTPSGSVPPTGFEPAPPA